MEYLRKVVGQVWDFVKNLSPARKFSMVIISGVIMIGLGSMFFWAGDQTYQPLMSNLAPEDSANIIRILREKRIPFRLDSSGRNVSIPPENVMELRMELATMGLPQSGVIGYEVFDKQSLGTTSFVQKINQKRALEGELMRTINTINGVKRSRVHLATPTKSAFVEDQKKSTASVVVDLEPGTQLSEKQIYGMQNLIARAVEGLEINDVAVVDSFGKTLSRNSTDTLSGVTANQHDFRQKIERDFENKIEAMMSRIVGDGHVVARVNAEIDFSQIAETQTTYDADGTAVVSNQRDTKSMEGSRPGPAGLAGAASNTPGQIPTANNAVRTDTKTVNETTNYKVPETVRRVTRPSWEVKRLSVAVVVDGKTVRAPASAGSDETVTSKVEWSPEKIKEFESLVMNAVGIDKKRGDTIEIKNMEFSREDFDEAQRMITESERKVYINNLITYSVVGLIVLLFFLLVVRPFIKWFTDNTVESVDAFLPQTIEELEKIQKSQVLQSFDESIPTVQEKLDPDKVEGEMLKEKIITLIDANPHKAALILKDWLHGEANAAKKAADAAAAKSKTA